MACAIVQVVPCLLQKFGLLLVLKKMRHNDRVLCRALFLLRLLEVGLKLGVKKLRARYTLGFYMW